MINLHQQPRSFLAYLCVLIAGISIFVMLIIEYNQAKQLIADNRILMRNIVLKTMQTNIQDSFTAYPLSADEIEKSWLRLSANFVAYKHTEAIYPYRFKGIESNRLSPLWDSYKKAIASGDMLQSMLSEQSVARINALRDILQSLSNPDENKLQLATQRYFDEINNYRLSPLEELVSGLSFLTIAPDARWNDALISQVLSGQTLQSESLYTVLFKRHQLMASADLKYAIDGIKAILQASGLDASWFIQNTKALWASPPKFSASNLDDFALIDERWIAIKASKELSLVVPVNIDMELQNIHQQLVAQGVLNEQDSIKVLANVERPYQISLHELPFTLSRQHWRDQLRNQQYYLGVKLFALLGLIVCLVLLSKWFIYKHQKKLEFIAQRENFINMVSHELKTPLASIRIMVETLLKRSNAKLSIKDYPQKVIKEVDHLWLMVDNLLSLSRLKSNEVSLKLELTKLYDLLERVIGKWQSEHPNMLECKNEVPRDYIANIDTMMFELVLTNLFSNAIKYCDKDKATIRLFVHQQALFMQDNACGIEQSHWQRVFDDFYREQNKHSKQGTGIGLALCKQLMLLHKGTINIDASSDSGTTWRLEFAEEGTV